MTDEPTMLTPADAKKFLVTHLARLGNALWDIEGAPFGATALIHLGNWTYTVGAVCKGNNGRGAITFGLQSLDGTVGVGHGAIGSLSESGWGKAMEHIISHASGPDSAPVYLQGVMEGGLSSDDDGPFEECHDDCPEGSHLLVDGDIVLTGSEAPETKPMEAEGVGPAACVNGCNGTASCSECPEVTIPGASSE